MMKKYGNIRIIQKLFSKLDIAKRQMYLEKKIAQNVKLISKDNKIMQDTQLIFKDNYFQYLKYIESLKTQQEIEENQNQINRRLLYMKKQAKKIKPISFTDFEKKYKNFPLLEYLDYYDIQKINKQEKEKEFENFRLIEKNNNNIKNSMSLNLQFSKDKTPLNRELSLCNENNPFKIDNYKIYKCNNFIRRTRGSSENKNSSNDKNGINISGLDIKLIKKIHIETDKINKKIKNLKFNADLDKEKNKNTKNSKLNLCFNNDNNECSNDQIIENKISKDFKSKKELKLLKLNKQIEKFKKKENNLKNINIPVRKNELFKEKHLYYVNYIPNTTFYKHLSFQKECMFNHEIRPKTKNKYDELSRIKNLKDNFKYYRTEKKLSIPNNKKFISNENTNNILHNSNEIEINSKLIKKILRTDSNYTTRVITKGSNRYKKNNNPNDIEKQIMKRETRKEKFDSPEEIKIIKKEYQKPRKSVFRSLDKIEKKLSSKNIQLSSEIKNRFNKSLNELCKIEKKEKIIIQKMKKGNFQLRAEENKQSKIRLKKMKNEIKLQDHFIKYLTQKVHTEYNEAISEAC